MNRRPALRVQEGMQKRAPLQVVWFKRDLRIEDHVPLTRAAAAGPVLPLYVVEPALWREADASGRQWGFVRECLDELGMDLGALGQPLVVRVGDAVAVLEDVRRAHGIAALWSHEETGNAWTYARDRRVGAWCREHGIPWHEPRQTGVQRRLASRNGWAAAWDRQMAEPVAEPPRVLPPLEGVDCDRLPTANDLGMAEDPCSERQRGGRRLAIRSLESFLFERGRDYRRAMSSPLEGTQACSRLSPYLAWGALSMKETAQATWARLRDLKSEAKSRETAAWRGSMISFGGRLHWHCHFMQKLEDEPRLEFEALHRAFQNMRPAEPDGALLDAWCRGETGYPFLDACMRSLAATGWLNFRMRAMVMSFASYNLWLPWRASGLHLARQFTDYEPGIHWPQVQMQSGTTGINTLRVYNVVKQGYDQDPTGVFVRRWVPELADVPDDFVHEPWRWDGFGALVGRRYPVRVVDHQATAAAAKARMFAARRGGAFHLEANAIQDKHGSRKSGIPMTGQPSGVRTAKKRLGKVSQDAPRQLLLDLDG